MYYLKGRKQEYIRFSLSGSDSFHYIGHIGLSLVKLSSATSISQRRNY
jgi:hypothetical protein